MCCNSDPKATQQVRRRKNTFVGYKVVHCEENPRPASPGASLTTGADENFVVRSMFGNMRWKPGTHNARNRNRTTVGIATSVAHARHLVLNREKYNPMVPCGFHFYFSRKTAQLEENLFAKYFLLPVRINPKDIIAAERRGRRNRQGVALKVTVSKQAWRKLQEVCILRGAAE